MWSLERRLRRHLLVALSLLWLIGAGSSLYSQWEEMNELLDAAQEESAITLLRMPTLMAGERVLKALPLAQTAHGQTVRSQVFTSNGRLLWRSADAPDTPLLALSQLGFKDVGDWRIVVRRAPELDRVAIVATSLHDRREALVDGAQALGLPLLILLPLTAQGLTWLLRRTFRQLGELREELKSRDKLELRPLSVEGLPTEIAPLVAEINTQFAQLKRVRDAERSFAANSAHELRTPIAAALAQLHRLARDIEDLPAVDDARQAALSQRLGAMDRQLNKLQHLCVKLLQLSRAHSGVERVMTPVNLAQLAQLVMEEFGAAVKQGRLRLDVPADSGDIMAMGDVDVLAIALRNLIENALEHGGLQAHVQVRVTTAPSIDVIDDGPGVAAASLDKLREPFQRGNTSACGHGIGLAIVCAIADQLHGSLELVSPHAQGHGMLARLNLRPAPPVSRPG